MTLGHTNKWVDIIYTLSIFGHVCKTVKSDYQLCRFYLSICMEELGSRWMDFHEI
jgi:hypothetical protein